jgi:putative hydrolases of HD superfamily
MAETTTDAVIALGQLSLAFGRVNRITYHPDTPTAPGQPESDTDHTVMLGLIACGLAAAHTDLDVGQVAQDALVHDVTEVRAGDTPTLGGLSDEEKAAKKHREREAQEWISNTYATTVPWLPVTLAAYEAQITRESRFVRAVDKLMPKLTHLANGCRTLIEQGVDPDRQDARYVEQRAEIAVYAGEWPWLLDLHAELAGRVMALYRSILGAGVAA